MLAAVLLHILNVIAEKPIVVRLPPPWTYELYDLRIHVEDTVCVDVSLVRRGGPRPTRSWLIKTQCFIPNDYDSPPGGHYDYKKMPFKYRIRGSDFIHLEFATRSPTAREAAELAVKSGDPAAVWDFAKPPTTPKKPVNFSGWLERTK